ncbi:MAG: hypothetical protein AAF408_15535, partial [Pseudomonadota bacterium]
MRLALLLLAAALLALMLVGFPYLAEAWAAPGDRSRIVAAVLGVIGTALTALGAFGLWSLQHRADQ